VDLHHGRGGLARAHDGEQASHHARSSRSRAMASGCCA
jgi:hypothetical protein